MNRDPSLHNRAALVSPLLAGTLALGLSGCGGSSPNQAPQAPSSTTSTAPVPETPTASTLVATDVTLRFDALGGGSSIIRVFPGVKDTSQDKLANGTFADGQTAPAVCKTSGRRVNSDPSVGERKRSSGEWVRVVGTPGETQYATLTYADVSRQGLAKLKQCQDVQ